MKKNSATAIFAGAARTKLAELSDEDLVQAYQTALNENNLEQRDKYAAALVERLRALTNSIAGRLFVRIPYTPLYDIDDLKQCGFIATLDAAGKYSNTKDCSFRTYVTGRIEGSIKEWIRSNPAGPVHIPRSVIEVKKKIQSMPKTKSDGKILTEEQIDKELIRQGITPEFIAYARFKWAGIDAKDIDLSYKGDPVFNEVLGRETMSMLAALIEKRLSPEQRTRLERVYLEGAVAKDLAKEEGVTRAAISIANKYAIECLRNILRTHPDLATANDLFPDTGEPIPILKKP
jgi:RNA polymerase sigma factor for flagellar operon FliA